MTSRLSLAAALLLAGSPVLAGGLAQPVVVASPAPVAVVPVASPVPAPSADWSGFYVGGQLGFGRLSLEADGPIGNDDEYEGSTFGVHAGYMFDFGRIVAGAEIDFEGTQISVGEGDGAIDVSSIARAKLRLGYDAGRFLPYVTAGFAQARFSSDDEGVDESLEDSYDGTFVGLGAAYALNDRFAVGVEALRHDFGDAPVEGVDTMVDTISFRGTIRF